MKTLFETIMDKAGVGRIHQIQTWLDEHRVKKYKVNKAGEIDVAGDVTLIKYELDQLPDYIQFGTVKGNFDCSAIGLTTLKGMPRVIKGSFDCSGNRLTSLEGAPKEVWMAFDCSSNRLTSLAGCPEAYSDLSCSHNELTSLEGAPKVIKGIFDCYYNKLKTLVGGPEEVRKNFLCDHNDLTSLEGAPKTVMGFFNCSDNKTKFTEKDVKKVCNVGGEISV